MLSAELKGPPCGRRLDQNAERRGDSAGPAHEVLGRSTVHLSGTGVVAIRVISWQSLTLFCSENVNETKLRSKD